MLQPVISSSMIAACGFTSPLVPAPAISAKSSSPHLQYLWRLCPPRPFSSYTCFKVASPSYLPSRPASTSTISSSFISLTALSAIFSSKDGTSSCKKGEKRVERKCSLVVIGLNLNTAPAKVSDKLAFKQKEYGSVIKPLIGLPSVEEAIVLSDFPTYGFLVYAVVQPPSLGIEEIISWMSERSEVPVTELKKHIFVHRDSKAASYIYKASFALDEDRDTFGLTLISDVRELGVKCGGHGVILYLLCLETPMLHVARAMHVYGPFSSSPAPRQLKASEFEELIDGTVKNFETNMSNKLEDGFYGEAARNAKVPYYQYFNEKN